MASMALYSCKQDLQPQDSPNDEAAAITEATQDPDANMNQMQPAAQAQPQDMASPQMQPQQAPVTNVAPGMNPAHGQPGHRCDIQVGAPLNSPAGKPAAAPITTPVQTQQPTQGAPSILNAPTSNTAVGMNPPHGQPGHKCEVAVGAPL